MTHLVLAIIASVMSFVMFSMAVFVIAEDARRLSRGFGYQRQWYDYDNQKNQHVSWEYASRSAAYGKVF